MNKWISWALLALIGMFALTTIGNVANFVYGYHAGWQGYTLGMALGFALFITAYISASTSSERTRRRAFTCAIIFGISSAYFQFSIYAEHAETMHDIINAALLAFVPILVGEAGLALVESSVNDDKGRAESEMTNMQSIVAELRNELANANDELSAESRRRMDAEKHNESLRSENAELKEVRVVVKEKSAPKSKQNSAPKPEQRRSKMASWLVQNYSGMTFEDVPRKDIVEEFGISRDTALSDLKKVWERQDWNGEVPSGVA